MYEKLIFAFLIGGSICVFGQLIMDVLKITPAHTTCTLVVIGSILGGLGLYDPLVNLAGAGAYIPICSFGNSLVKGALSESQKNGLLGLLSGIFEITGTGISAAIIFGFFASLVFKPRG